MKKLDNNIYEKPVLSLTSLALEDCVLECCSIQTVNLGVTVDEYVEEPDVLLHSEYDW